MKVYTLKNKPKTIKKSSPHFKFLIKKICNRKSKGGDEYLIYPIILFSLDAWGSLFGSRILNGISPRFTSQPTDIKFFCFVFIICEFLYGGQNGNYP